MPSFAENNLGASPATDADFAAGFAPCGIGGIAPTTANINAVLLRIIAEQSTIDITALATALCANTVFRTCVLAITNAAPIAPGLPSDGPFTDSGVQLTAI